MNQGSGGSGSNQVDSSVLDEKNRQRLKDLEDAMRSTWEAKAKMSEEHERDRQQLLIDQQNAARQFEAARLRNWALMEQKGDLDITLSHVRALVTDRLSQSTVALLLVQWTEALREVSVLERKLGEQDTVVQVYRSSLGKDSHKLLQVSFFWSCLAKNYVFMFTYLPIYNFSNNYRSVSQAVVGPCPSTIPHSACSDSCARSSP